MTCSNKLTRLGGEPGFQELISLEVSIVTRPQRILSSWYCLVKLNSGEQRQDFQPNISQLNFAFPAPREQVHDEFADGRAFSLGDNSSIWRITVCLSYSSCFMLRWTWPKPSWGKKGNRGIPAQVANKQLNTLVVYTILCNKNRRPQYQIEYFFKIIYQLSPGLTSPLGSSNLERKSEKKKKTSHSLKK